MTNTRALFPMIVLCFAVIACSSSQQKDKRLDTTSVAQGTVSNAPFDLAKLTLKEQNVPGMLAERKVKTEPLTATDQTIFGYERLKASSADVLRFDGADLSGNNDTLKNNVLLHYNEKLKALAFYKVRLYTTQQAAALVAALQKIGRPAFEKVGLSKGAIEIDEMGMRLKRAKKISKPSAYGKIAKTD